MTRTLIVGLVFTLVSAFSIRLASADTVYDTVDAIEAAGSGGIRVTGIVAGEQAQSVTFYFLGSGSETGLRCDRLALLAMSKPGKFQFVVVNSGPGSGNACKLIVRT